MKKRLFAIILTACIIASLLPMRAAAASYDYQITWKVYVYDEEGNWQLGSLPSKNTTAALGGWSWDYRGKEYLMKSRQSSATNVSASVYHPTQLWAYSAVQYSFLGWSKLGATLTPEYAPFSGQTGGPYLVSTRTATYYYILKETSGKPAKPSNAQAEGLSGVVIDCTNAGQTHGDLASPLLPGTYTIGSVNGSRSKGYTCEITLTDLAPYGAAYGKSANGGGKTHTPAPGQGSPTAVLRYDGTTGSWLVHTAASVRVMCENAPAAPGEDVIEALLDQAAAVECVGPAPAGACPHDRDEKYDLLPGDLIGEAPAVYQDGAGNFLVSLELSPAGISRCMALFAAEEGNGGYDFALNADSKRTCQLIWDKQAGAWKLKEGAVLRLNCVKHPAVRYRDGVNQTAFSDQVYTAGQGQPIPPFQPAAGSGPARDGYDFLGWDWCAPEDENTTLTPAPAVMPAGGLIATARWRCDGNHEDPDGDGECDKDGCDEPVNAGYTVRHCLENLTGGGYTPDEDAQESKIGAIGGWTAAQSRAYHGFTPRAFDQKRIAGDGGTVVDIRYDRNLCGVIYTDGLAKREAFPDQCYEMKYGAAVPAFVGSPAYPGHRFEGWSRAEDSHGNLTFTAGWTALSPVLPAGGTGVLTKTDARDGSRRLAGAVFELYRADAGRYTLVGRYATDGSGRIAVDGLTDGAYYWVETAAPRGYVLGGQRWEFFISGGSTAALTVPNTAEASGVSPRFRQDHQAYLVGFPDGLIHPEDPLTRAEAATIFFRLLSDETRTQHLTRQSPFLDVEAADWYCAAVSTMAAMGAVTGQSQDAFCPEDRITRGEFAAMAARFAAEGRTEGVTFRDTAGHWARREIGLAAAQGWILGDGDGLFRPEDLITRSEAAAMVNRMLERNPQSNSDLLPGMLCWTDNADPQKWYYLDIQEAGNSHDYIRRNDGGECWTALRQPPEWTRLER